MRSTAASGAEARLSCDGLTGVTGSVRDPATPFLGLEGYSLGSDDEGLGLRERSERLAEPTNSWSPLKFAGLRWMGEGLRERSSTRDRLPQSRACSSTLRRRRRRVGIVETPGRGPAPPRPRPRPSAGRLFNGWPMSTGRLATSEPNCEARRAACVVE